MVAVHQIAVELDVLVLAYLNRGIGSIFRGSISLYLRDNGARVTINEGDELARKFAVAIFHLHQLGKRLRDHDACRVCSLHKIFEEKTEERSDEVHEIPSPEEAGGSGFEQHSAVVVQRVDI